MTDMTLNRDILLAKKFWQAVVNDPVEPARPKPDFNHLPDTERAQVEFTVPAPLVEKLTKLAKGEFLSAAVVLAALRVVLYRLAPVARQSIVTPGRSGKNGECDLLLIEEMDGALCFRDLLMNVRDTMLHAQDHQTFDFRKLLGQGQQTYTSVSFSFDPVHQPFQGDGGDLSFDFAYKDGNLTGFIGYPRQAYLSQTLRYMAGALEQVLEQGLDNVDRKISDFDLMSPDRLSMLLAKWNDTKTDYCLNETVIDHLRRQAQQAPDRIALSYQGVDLSYGALMGLIEAKAKGLIARGVGRESLVGVCMANPCQAVIAKLSILCAGGAFVPLDPSYPRDRLSFMVSDSAMGFILSDDTTYGDVFDGFNNLLMWQDVCSAGEGTYELPTLQADQAAYVIYTSGSTGRPKGAVLEHRGLTNLALGQIDFFGISAASRVLQFASFSFDASISEIFTALCSGATLVLADRADMMPGPVLSDLLKREHISHVTLAPSLLGVMPDADFPDLKGLIVAGEASSPTIVEKWGSGRTLYNGYGPTEGTVCATMARYDGDGYFSIGRPMANTRIHILDEHLKPVAPGVEGEVYIESVGLARAYLNRHELTKERFIENPFAVTFNDRLYKTGDVARWRFDGRLDFIGRADFQVKFRGFRIEPDEIAHQIERICAAKNVVVDLVAGDIGPHLVAYLQAGEGAINVDQLRADLNEILPSHMVPTHFMTLDSFPRLPNGKINRNGFPDVSAADGMSMIKPTDRIEMQLLTIWQELLEHKSFSRSSDFFAVGGYSLLAVRLLARIQSDFGCQMRLDELMTCSVFQKQADFIRSNGEMDKKDAVLVPLRASTNEGALNVIFAHPAGGRFLCYLDLVQACPNDWAVFALQSAGLEGQDPRPDCFDEMITDYVQRYQALGRTGNCMIVGWSGGAVIAYAMAQALERLGERVRGLVLLDGYAPDCLPMDLRGLSDGDLMASLLGGGAQPTDFDGEDAVVILHEKLRAQGLIPDTYDVDHTRTFFAVYKNNCAFAHAPQQAGLTAPCLLVRAADEIPLQQKYCPNDETLGWADLVADLTRHVVPGSHESILSAQSVPYLVHLMRDQFSL